MKNIIIIAIIMLAAATGCNGCSGGAAVSTVQAVANPYHLVVTTDGAATVDLNVSGQALCASGQVTVEVHKVAENTSEPLAKWTPGVQSGPVAYGWEYEDEGGWTAYELDPTTGAQRYPVAFARCAGDTAAAMKRAPTTRILRWQERTSTPKSEQ